MSTRVLDFLPSPAWTVRDAFRSSSDLIAGTNRSVIGSAIVSLSRELNRLDRARSREKEIMAVGFLAVLVFLPFSPIFSVLSLSAVTYGFFTFRASNKQYGLVKSVKDQIEESMRESALAPMSYEGLGIMDVAPISV